MPVTALPVEDEESFITAPDELFSEEFIRPVSLADPVPVTALPVPDEELSGTESVVIVVASDESELQDAKQKVAAMKIIIVMCFMIMIILDKNLPEKCLGQEVAKSAIHHDYLKFISVAILSAICKCICSLGRYLFA